MGTFQLKRHHLFNSLHRSIDPDRIRDVMANAMMTFAIAIAAVTSTTAAAITMGLSMGSTISGVFCVLCFVLNEYTI
jgi:hypothetical protein